MATQAATAKQVGKPIPMSLNYTEVFYSNKKTVLTLGGAHPGKELADIFVGGHKEQTDGATLSRGNHQNDELGTPIREDENEHHDMEALLYENRGRNSRRLNQKKNSRPHLTDVESNTKELNKSGTVSKWLGKVFEVNRNDTSVDLNGSKKLMFAGMNQSKKQIPQPTVQRSAKGRAQ